LIFIILYIVSLIISVGFVLGAVIVDRGFKTNSRNIYEIFTMLSCIPIVNTVLAVVLILIVISKLLVQLAKSKQ
jgi:uncharacterized membrane protein